MFPGNPGANTLSANVPGLLPVGMAVDYECTGITWEVFGNPTSNECDNQGMYGPVATCALGKWNIIFVE